MTNKTVSFRLPQELIAVLDNQASRSGKTKTDLIIEAIAQVYDVSTPVSANQTLASVQQQADALRDEIEFLKLERKTQGQTCLQAYTNNFVAAVQQALKSLKAVNNLLGGDLNTIATLPDHADNFDSEAFDIVAASASSPFSHWVETEEVLRHRSQTTFLNQEVSHYPGLLTLQVQYQLKAFDHLFAAIPELVFICDRSGNLTYVSPFVARVWGVEQQELLGQNYYDVAIPKEFLEFNLAQLGTVLSFGKLSSAELAVTSGHTTRYYDYSLSPIHDDTGVVIGVVGTAVDFTQWKQAELDLRDSLEQCRALFEFANDLIFTVDVETHQILDTNIKAARRLHYTRKELSQMILEDIETPDATAYFQSVVVPQLERTGSALFNHFLRCKDGEIIPVEVSARLIDFGDHLAYQSFARDLSNRNENLTS